jgi:predicted  nucleic acid-binding Zn-ribbon protein
MAAATFDLFRLRITVENVKTQIANLSQQVDAMRAVQDRIREVAAGVAAQPPSPEVQNNLSSIQEHWDRTWHEVERLNAEIAGLTTEKLKLQRTLLEQAVTYSVEYGETLQQAWIALRTELDFPIEHEKLEALSKRVDAEMMPKFRALLDAIDSDSDGPAAAV